MARRQPLPTRRRSAPRKKASAPPKARRAGTKRTPPRAGGADGSDGGSGLAPGMHAITTYLAVANITATMEFLERAFGFSRGVVLPDADGQIRYAEMRHGESVVMLVRKGDSATASGGTAALYTYVADVDLVLGRAREAGAGVAEAEDKPWGDRVASVTDPDGYRWMLATFKKLVPFS